MSRLAPNFSSRPRVLTATLTVLGVLTAAAALVSPAMGSTEPAADGMQTSVYYTRLDLASEQGTRALYRRIERAAEDVCPGSDSRYPSAVAASKECERSAIARAIGQIGSTRLAAIEAQAVSRQG